MRFSEEIRTYAHLGRALWSDPAEGEPIAVDVLSGVSLLQLDEERRYERAARVLLTRALKTQGPEHLRFDQPFFRLTPRERFLLVAVHVGNWSYERVARVLDEPVLAIEAALWSTRLSLASQTERALRSYPVGSAVRGVSCPEYDLERPWTQRFLDDESPPGRDRIFLQNHLMACEACRRALSRCRDVYYAVDKLIPRLRENETFLRGLERIEAAGVRVARGRAGMTPGESLILFFNRRETRATLLAFAFLLISLGFLFSRLNG